jgi:hypothetical protein
VRTGFICVKFEVLTEVVIKSSNFCDITSSSLLKFNRSFGGTCRLHLQKIPIRAALAACFAFRFFFNPEHLGDTFHVILVDF